MRRIVWTASVAAAAVAISLVAGLVVRAAANGDTRTLTVPAAIGSGMYSLASAADGTAYLSWLEPQPGNLQALKFATFRNGAWSPAREVARSDNWFVNWADHPSVVPLSNGSLVAHWLPNNGGKEGNYGYGFRIALSTDQGTPWREVYAGGTDNLHGYSGFVTLLPSGDGFTAVYLGPPKQKTADTEADHTMTLSAIRFDARGRVVGEDVVDGGTCSCCSTSMVMTAAGPLAAYRDRAPGEIRDISVSHLQKGGWTEPHSVQRDGWAINACPTNGPSLAARGANVAVSWFTAAANRPIVKFAFSADAGVTFKTAGVIDAAKPVGWPATVLLDDGSAVVSWLATTGGGSGEIRLRRVWSDGRVGEPVVVTTAAAGRSTGIPQMVRAGDGLLLAWRTDRVQAALVPIPAR